MSFQVNHSEAGSDRVLLPEGEYEVIFKNVSEGLSKNGIPIVDIVLIVRNDVEQQFKNKYVWDTLWPVKTPTQLDRSVSGFSYKRIQQMSKAAGIPNGKEFSNIAEWCEEFANRVARVVIYHELYEGKTKAKIKWYNESNYPSCKHTWVHEDEEAYITDEEPATTASTPPVQSKPPVQTKKAQVVNDDDVPF
ncbi:MAG: DUF669 domain-containing protein [Methanolobus sp.]|nr:DUF669 domain-containing protein [Methanolobus sp.]